MPRRLYREKHREELILKDRERYQKQKPEKPVEKPSARAKQQPEGETYYQCPDCGAPPFNKKDFIYHRQVKHKGSTAKPNAESINETDCQKFCRIMKDKASGKISPTFDVIVWLNGHASDCDDCAKWYTQNKRKTSMLTTDQWLGSSEPVVSSVSHGELDVQIQRNMERQDAEMKGRIDERTQLEGEKQQLIDALEKRKKEQSQNLFQDDEEEKANEGSV
jgi:uncharacterized C2H2 Zn-finger protein